MNDSRRRSGFTLIEVLIVVVIMAVLAATIIPQFSSSTEDAKASTLKFNLHTMRSQIELYKLQHNGLLPQITSNSLPQLTSNTKVDGTVGTGASFPLGPYVQGELPANPFDGKKTVTAATFPFDATEAAAGGWIYDASTGKIAAGHATYYVE